MASFALAGGEAVGNFWKPNMHHAPNNRLEIKEVSGNRDLKAFIRVPWRIYKDDPNWVPPLLFERKEAFSRSHPYFRHARWCAWVAYRNGQPVGRISAQIDDLHLQEHETKTGFLD